MNSLLKKLGGSGRELIDIMFFAVPNRRIEWFVFGSFFTFALFFALFFLYTTCVIDNPNNAAYDMYFGFDNVRFFHTGGQLKSTHPLLWLFMMPLFTFAEFAAELLGYKAKGLILVLSCSVAIALAVTYIFRYLDRVLELEKKVSLVLILFLSSFSTTIVLAFTLESFTYSMLFLSLCLLYFSYSLIKDKRISLTSSLAFSFLLGGITITNAVKPLIPNFFYRKSWKEKILPFVLIGAIFLFIYIAHQLNYRLFFEFRQSYLVYLDLGYYEGKLYEKIIDMFWGNPILLSSMWLGELDKVHLNYYEHAFQYIIIGTIACLFIASIVLNYRHQLFQLILCFFIVDLGIHVICQFGIGEAFIYGGHWVFIVPLVIGWLFKSISIKYSKCLIIIILVLSLALFANNIFRLYELWEIVRVPYAPI